MNWVKQEHFTASASFHGVIFSSTCSYVILLVEMRSYIILLCDSFQGALVANYPWDGTKDTGCVLLFRFSFNYLN
jgi:hypothetical protein